MKRNLKKEFLLDPDIHFLNHGSFGACPRPVFEVYQSFQRELEKKPVEFLGRQIIKRMEETRSILAEYINCQANEVVFFPNPTTAINMVARNLELENGDEILSTDHEYGAMDRTWRYIARRLGAKYINQPMPLPMTTQGEFIERFWEGVTERTKVIFVSHITSPTALTFPVVEICEKAREAGILTIIDGAHLPGQIPLDLGEINADIYTGACHKWLCAPKGASFLFARKEVQEWLEPLVVSWGYEAEKPTTSQFIDYHEWQGTRDMSAFLSVTSAIRFQEENDWPEVRVRCHQLAANAREQINELTGQEPLCPEDGEWFEQMATVRLPELNTEILQSRLFNDYRVEVPVFKWNDQPYLRVSVQGYNDEDDIIALVDALEILIPEISK